MNSRNRSRKKGMSISEMCVVLAVVAIAALAVVSFTTMVSARSMASASRLQALEGIQRTELIVEQWIDVMVSNDAASISVSADGTALTAVIGTEEYTVALSDDKIVAQLPDGNEMSMSVEEIKELRFETMTKTDDALYFCTATYKLSKDVNAIGTYTFCVNPHAGEILN